MGNFNQIRIDVYYIARSSCELPKVHSAGRVRIEPYTFHSGHFPWIFTVFRGLHGNFLVALPVVHLRLEYDSTH